MPAIRGRIRIDPVMVIAGVLRGHGLRRFPSWSAASYARRGAAVTLLILAVVFCLESSKQAALANTAGAAACCLAGWLLGTIRPSRSGRAVAAHMQRTHDIQRADGDAIEVVKFALVNLSDPEALSASPLASQGKRDVSELQSLLHAAVDEIAKSPNSRDCESGRLLLDYYIKRVGSHGVVMERLYMSRPTFYRRLNRGLWLVARRMDLVASA
jgi:hypothetical protein